MLRRKVYDELVSWKNHDAHKALILIGARQVGKTFIVKEFAKAHFASVVTVDFIDDEESGAFLAAAKSSDDLLSRLTLISGVPLTPGTLIFFDEVQHLGHDIVTLSKFLVEDGRFRLILSGSLLGTALEGVRSFPVGYAKTVEMHPLDFEEFCWAMGVGEAILDDVREAYRLKAALDDPLHAKLVELFRRFIVVGGMPEAVQTFLDSELDLARARAVASELVMQYRYDIIKYAKQRKTRILGIYDSLPSQLAKENKRYHMDSQGKGSTFDRLEDDFVWLEGAGVALTCCQVREPTYPLVRTKNERRFKLYSLDTGILLAQYPLRAARDIAMGAGDANFGAVYENALAAQLTAAGIDLFYYANNRRGEVDFLFENAHGRVIPIEVKSGKDYKRHVALTNLLVTTNFAIDEAYVLSEAQLTRGERSGKPIWYLPLYMSLCFEEDLRLPEAFGKLQPVSL